MKHLGILLLSTLSIAACASNNNNPPPASSDSVAAATARPHTGPDFAPAASDGLATAPADTHRANHQTQAANGLNTPVDSSPSTARANNTATNSTGTGANTTSSNGTWGNGTTTDSAVDRTAGNAAAAPTDRSSGTDADNSRVNQRDKGNSSLTPMDQGGSEADRKLTQQIRQEVMKDKSLSFTAKNVKIITINGKVTLRGPVKSEAERTAIEATARRIAGSGAQVDSQLELSK